MIYLRTGQPGASKTLNTLREIVKSHDSQREKYYNNIRLLLLDMDVCQTFSGWFYGWFFPNLKDKVLRRRLEKIMKPLHKVGDFLDLEHAPFLNAHYHAHDHFDTWIFWVRKVYKSSDLEELENVLAASKDFECDRFELSKRFNLHFTQFDDPFKWYELPGTSIVIVDECQQFYPPRSVGSKKPEYIGKFETHRHTGHDLHLITQHGTLIDANIRKLVNIHVGFYNPMGGSQVNRYEARKYSDFNDHFQKKEAKKSPIHRDSDFYGLYWSAEIHTDKFRFPKVLLLLPLSLALMVYCCYFLYTSFFGIADQVTGGQGASTEVSKSSSSEPAAPTDPLSQLVSKYTTNVFISGSVYVRKSSGESYYVYSFYDADTDELFYPNNMGMTVIAQSSCFAILKIESISRPVICNPNYNSNFVDPSDQPKKLERGDKVTGSSDIKFL